MASRTWLSGVLVVLAAASSVATSRTRESWELEAPAVDATALELTPAVPEQLRGAEVTVSRELVDYDQATGGSIKLMGSVRWLDPPTDPRPAKLAIDFVPIGRPETWSVRKEIEVGRKAAQPIDLRQDVRLDECVKGYACTMDYEVRFTWLEPRGGRLAIAWSVDGTMMWAGYEKREAPPGATMRVAPTEPRELSRAVDLPSSDQPNPFPASP